MLRAWLAAGGTLTAFADLNGYSRQYAEKLARQT